MRRTSSSKQQHVLIVASSLQTIADLKAYLTQSGLTSAGTRHLEELLFTPLSLDAVVVFPDDFDTDELTKTLQSLRRAKPRLLIVVITSAPQQLLAALDVDGRSRQPLVLAKPAFGWTVLDAIRGTFGLSSP